MTLWDLEQFLKKTKGELYLSFKDNGLFRVDIYTVDGEESEGQSKTLVQALENLLINMREKERQPKTRATSKEDLIHFNVSVAPLSPMVSPCSKCGDTQSSNRKLITGIGVVCVNGSPIQPCGRIQP